MQIPPGVWPEGVNFSRILTLCMQQVTRGTDLSCTQIGPATVSLYTDSVDVPAGVIFMSDPVFFGPSGSRFAEPGVKMGFTADPDTLQPDMQILTYKVVFKL